MENPSCRSPNQIGDAAQGCHPVQTRAASGQAGQGKTQLGWPRRQVPVTHSCLPDMGTGFMAMRIRGMKASLPCGAGVGWGGGGGGWGWGGPPRRAQPSPD